MLLIPLTAFLAPLASAHELATDGSIGAVIHIDPSDEPIAGERSAFFFEFKDKQNKFQPTNCACTFSIVTNGQTVYSQPLFQDNAKPTLDNASASYTFEAKGAYTIKVTGKSLTPNAFAPFTLVWDIRVDQQAKQTDSGQNNFVQTHIAHFVAIGVFALFFLSYLFVRLMKRKNDTIGV